MILLVKISSISVDSTRDLYDELIADTRNDIILFHVGIQKFLRETVKKCTQDGFVQTIMGRRRYLPAIKETNPYKKAQV